MKFGRFEQNGRIFYGTVEGDQVSELEGSIFDRYQATSKKHALSAVKTLVPCVPPTFYCAGLNYAAHIEWANKRKGTNTPLPAKADIGYRANSALAAKSFRSLTARRSLIWMPSLRRRTMRSL